MTNQNDTDSQKQFTLIYGGKAAVATTESLAEQEGLTPSKIQLKINLRELGVPLSYPYRELVLEVSNFQTSRQPGQMPSGKQIHAVLKPGTLGSGINANSFALDINRQDEETAHPASLPDIRKGTHIKPVSFFDLKQMLAEQVFTKEAFDNETRATVLKALDGFINAVTNSNDQVLNQSHDLQKAYLRPFIEDINLPSYRVWQEPDLHGKGEEWKVNVSTGKVVLYEAADECGQGDMSRYLLTIAGGNAVNPIQIRIKSSIDKNDIAHNAYWITVPAQYSDRSESTQIIMRFEPETPRKLDVETLKDSLKSWLIENGFSKHQQDIVRLVATAIHTIERGHPCTVGAESLKSMDISLGTELDRLSQVTPPTTGLKAERAERVSSPPGIQHMIPGG